MTKSVSVKWLVAGVVVLAIGFYLVGFAGLVGNVFAGQGDKVEMCHVPPGDPDNAHVISINAAAVDAHLAHGDFLGACGGFPPPPE